MNLVTTHPPDSRHPRHGVQELLPTPARVGREQWDVIDQAGKLVARWRLPARTTLVAVGQGVVYTTRTDEDDLRYLQRVELGK